MSLPLAAFATGRSTADHGGRCKGITLVEVVVALLLLAVGAMVLAAGIGAGERARRQAISRGLAQAAAEGWLESWRTAPWPDPPSDIDGAGEAAVQWGGWRGWMRWRITSLTPCLAESRVEGGSAGGRASVVLVSRRFREGASGC